jgi:hypothetical protein
MANRCPHRFAAALNIEATAAARGPVSIHDLFDRQHILTQAMSGCFNFQRSLGGCAKNCGHDGTPMFSKTAAERFLYIYVNERITLTPPDLVNKLLKYKKKGRILHN